MLASVFIIDTVQFRAFGSPRSPLSAVGVSIVVCMGDESCIGHKFGVKCSGNSTGE